ncbi:MAG: response regulator [bacterium]|nr:response regulator [bacterium]
MMKKKVLVVDDDIDFLRLIRVWLSKAGYEVAVAVDGLSAISTARKETPDLIVLDVGMPAGGGATTLERMRNLVPLAGIPIVILTGQGEETTASQFLSAGADGFVRKMDSKEEILGTLREVIEAA